jgi:hypothetical protein
MSKDRILGVPNGNIRLIDATMVYLGRDTGRYLRRTSSSSGFRICSFRGSYSGLGVALLAPNPFQPVHKYPVKFFCLIGQPACQVLSLSGVIRKVI